MSDCIICWVSALTMALSPRGLRFWVRVIYILWWQNQQSNHFFNLSLNQYSIRQVTTVLRNLESVPVTKLMISWEKYHCGCPSVVFLGKMQSALPNQWTVWPPLALKVLPLRCSCLLFWVQAQPSSHSEWHMRGGIPAVRLDTALTLQPVTRYWEGRPAEGGVCALFKEDTNLKTF